MIRAMAWLALAALTVAAAQDSKVVFEDEFDGAKLGPQWKAYKSDSKPVDGVLVCIEPPDAGHNSVNSVNIDPAGDIRVDLSVKFVGAKRFAVAFNDRQYKGSHAGHICRLTLDATSLTFQDGRDGVFKNEIFEKRQASKGKKPDAAMRKVLEAHSSRIKMAFEKDRWYALSVIIRGEEMEALVDGKSAGKFSSKGIGHATKRNVALVTSGRQMHVDHLKISAPRS